MYNTLYPKCNGALAGNYKHTSKSYYNYNNTDQYNNYNNTDGYNDYNCIMIIIYLAGNIILL